MSMFLNRVLGHGHGRSGKIDFPATHCMSPPTHAHHMTCWVMRWRGPAVRCRKSLLPLFRGQHGRSRCGCPVCGCGHPYVCCKGSRAYIVQSAWLACSIPTCPGPLLHAPCIIQFQGQLRSGWGQSRSSLRAGRHHVVSASCLIYVVAEQASTTMAPSTCGAPAPRSASRTSSTARPALVRSAP